MKIEHNIPIPPRRRVTSAFPFEKLKINDSFVMPKPVIRASSYVCNASKRTGFKFTMRTIAKNATRIWRIA